MSSDVARLLEDALKLPDADRADLAACLWASLPADEPPLDSAWETEINRRLDAIEEGSGVWIDESEARRRMFGGG
jgi:putative addiction module component (TIGR02574 family)